MEEIGIFDYQPQHQETSSTSRAQISGPGAVDNDEDKDLYIKFKKLQRQLEFLQVGEEKLIMLMIIPNKKTVRLHVEWTV